MKRSKANITGPFPTNTILWILWQGCNGNWIDDNVFGKNRYTAFKVCLQHELVDDRQRGLPDYSWNTNDKGVRFLAQYHKKKLMK